MGVCLFPSSICKEKTIAINVHQSIGLEHLSSRNTDCVQKNIFTPKYNIQDIGYKIEINLIFFCKDNIIKNSYTYKFQLFIDNSGVEEENFSSLGTTDAMICQKKIKFNKVFETLYFFSKEQRIKICCYENEKNIITSSFYLGKMINGFENPKLIIEKNNEIIGELLILISKEENEILFKNKKCLFSFQLLKKFEFYDKGRYFFCINNHRNEIIYKSEEFECQKENENKDIFFEFSFEIRKHFIFYKNNSITLNLYLTKFDDTKYNLVKENKIINNNNSNINNEKNINENNNEEIKENKKIEYELISSTNLKLDELIKNGGINTFKIVKGNNGIIGSIFKESAIINVTYKEIDYTPFFEYIRFQLHLNLILVLENNILKNNILKNIINNFFMILSLYNNEEEKIIYIKLDKNLTIKKAKNIKECFAEEENGKNEEKDENQDDRKIIPAIEMIFKNYIHTEITKGINKYFIMLIFSENQFSDLNNELNDIESNMNVYQILQNIPLNLKFFNLNEENKYNESTNINMNIINNKGNLKYERKLFQFYNINNKKEKGNKYLNDIPFLIEDFFEIQKMAKFSIFDE